MKAPHKGKLRMLPKYDRYVWSGYRGKPFNPGFQRIRGQVIDDGIHGPYKCHFACFACRKSFKPREGSGSWATMEKCPECGGPVANMGITFKAPRRRNKRRWKQLERGG